MRYIIGMTLTFVKCPNDYAVAIPVELYENYILFKSLGSKTQLHHLIASLRDEGILRNDEMIQII